MYLYISIYWEFFIYKNIIFVMCKLVTRSCTTNIALVTFTVIIASHRGRFFFRGVGSE